MWIFFADNFSFFLIAIGVVGLLAGSFLNMFCYRFPIILQESWRRECKELLKLSHAVSNKKLNLFSPRSHCPRCKNTVSWWQNIPLMSFLVLRGKCAQCRQKISSRYLWMEFLCALLSVLIAWHFGVSWQTAAALIFTWILLALTCIDLEHQLLPDVLTLSLLWLGLLLSLMPFEISSADAIIGAAAGYLSLWLLGFLFLRVTGKVGMGHGDFKLCAALGAWFGWMYLPFILLFSAILGLLAGIVVISIKKDRNILIPFGPFLAIAGWVMLLWGHEILQLYFRVTL